MEAKKQPDKFYIDLSLTNNTSQPINAQLMETRNQNILDNPEDYELSVVRFECSMELIPIFIPVIPDPVNFPFRTQYSVTLLYNGVYYQEYVNIDQTEKTYGVYNFGIWVQHYNVAAQAAFARIPSPTAVTPPYFYYNPLLGRVQMFTELNYLDSNSGRIQIGIDQLSLGILNLPAIVFNGFSTPNGFDAVLAVEDYATPVPSYSNFSSRAGYPYFLSESKAAQGVDFLQVTTEFNNSASWSFVKGIIFTSNMVPVVKSYLPSGSGGNNQGNNVSSSFLPALTDFALPKSEGNFPIRGTAIYLPTAEYRRISMTKTSDFNILDFQAFIQDYNLNIYPITLRPGTNVSMKILFERKAKEIRLPTE